MGPAPAPAQKSREEGACRGLLWKEAGTHLYTEAKQSVLQAKTDIMKENYAANLEIGNPDDIHFSKARVLIHLKHSLELVL